MIVLILLLNEIIILHYHLVQYLPSLRGRERMILIFLFSGLIPFNGILYFILVAVLCPLSADTVISIEGTDGGFCRTNISTSL